MKVLLLGANGLLGHNVMNQLVEDGHEVRILVRNRAFEATGVDVRYGSFLDSGMLREVAQGCEAIVNCTGTTDMSLLRYEDYLPVNAQGVERIVHVMKESGIKTLVHVSTANTIGYGRAGSEANEDEPMMMPFSQSYYALSKVESEKFLQRTAHNNDRWHIIIVNPGFMIGAFDNKPSSGQLLLAGYKKPFMVAPGGGKSFIAVSDAARAIVNALTMGRNGERYLLTGTEMSLKDFYRMQSEVCGYVQKLWVLPNWLLNLAGRLGDLIRMCGIKTQLSTRNVRQLMVREYYDNSRAREELGMPATDVREAVMEFFNWWNSR